MYFKDIKKEVFLQVLLAFFSLKWCLKSFGVPDTFWYFPTTGRNTPYKNSFLQVWWHYLFGDAHEGFFNDERLSQSEINKLKVLPDEHSTNMSSGSKNALILTLLEIVRISFIQVWIKILQFFMLEIAFKFYVFPHSEEIASNSCNVITRLKILESIQSYLKNTWTSHSNIIDQFHCLFWMPYLVDLFEFFLQITWMVISMLNSCIGSAAVAVALLKLR